MRTGLDASLILRKKGGATGKFFDYHLDQAYLLPPSARDVLGPERLCFFLRRVVAKLNLEGFCNQYGVEGGPAYAPEMLLSVWLPAYGLSVTGSRRLEQRIREDLTFRYLAGGGTPDHGTLNAFRRWQKQCDADDPNEGASMEVGREVPAQLEMQLGEIPARLERLQKSGLKKTSQSDADSRFLRERGGFLLGYTGTLAVSEDHLIVGHRVTQTTNDTAALLPMVELVEKQCGERTQRVSADSGFSSTDNLQTMVERNMDASLPDSNLARRLNRDGRLRLGSTPPAHRRMRRFRMKGLSKEAKEWTLATTAYNLTRMWRTN